MSHEHDESLLEFNARARSAPILRAADRLGLRLERIEGAQWRGDCPACRSRDSFVVNAERGAFACASGVRGDVIAMVRHVRGLSSNFEAATWINDDGGGDR